MRRIKALFILGTALLVTLFKMLFGRRRGLSAFVANYAADGLARVSPDERARMQGFGACIACGLCDRGTWTPSQDLAAPPSIMGFILSDSRNMPDFSAASPAVLHEQAAVLRQAERLCPAGVPIGQIVQFVGGKVGVSRVSLLPKAPNR